MASSLEGFYSVTASRNDSAVAELEVRIHAEHAVYFGHFPGQPVAPGAALTQMVVDEAQRLLVTDRPFSGARQVKFLSVLNPHITDTIMLRYSFSGTADAPQFACTGTYGETVFFKINGAFH
jgi:3-hydroxyacyl-[acyl-carrier-protein] dehydratase